MGLIEAGIYNAVYNFGFNSQGTVIFAGSQTQSSVNITIGFDIVNSADTVVGVFSAGSAGVSNSPFAPAVQQTSFMGQSSGVYNFNAPTTDNYVKRTWLSYSILYQGPSSGGNSSGINSITYVMPNLTFSKVSGFAEITDTGMQVVSSTQRYIRFETGGIYDLDAKGDWRHDTGNVSLVQTAGILYAANARVAVQGGSFPSDKRLKEDISEFNNGLETIKKLNPKWFKYKQRKNEMFDAGVIAQEVQVYTPEFIGNRSDGFLGVNYDAIQMSMLNAIKELANRVEYLEAKLSGSI
jgi:hypothetical protein